MRPKSYSFLTTLAAPAVRIQRSRLRPEIVSNVTRLARPAAGCLTNARLVSQACFYGKTFVSRIVLGRRTQTPINAKVWLL